MDHQRIGSSAAGMAGSAGGLDETAPDTGKDRHAPRNLFHTAGAETFRLGLVQRVEFTGITVCHKNIDTSRDGPVDDWCQSVGIEGAAPVERGDQNARDACQSLANARHQLISGSGTGAPKSVRKKSKSQPLSACSTCLL